MIFFTENIVWVFTIVFVLQIIKLAYHGHLLWLMKKKKLKFSRERRKLESLLVDQM
ncbi:uncharacterized protein METZ01_LOCUS156959 [marine metagenome]|uniref:Uncharacterized protein n=1 Tax=marine metagenome TaxID=408172 RepID=A0A382ARD4_9ZZZZ